MQVEVADFFDLSGQSESTRLDHRRFQGQAIDVQRVGARPEDDVVVNVRATRAEAGEGTVTETDSFDASALVSYGNVSESGPFATDRLQWEVVNRSTTDYTQSGAGAVYQAHINYVIRRMTVIEKLRREVPLDGPNNSVGPETQLAEEYGLLDREREELPQKLPTYLQPNLDDKVIRELESEVATFDVSGTGTGDGAQVAKESNLRQRGLVAYVTGLEINSQEFTATDNLKVRFTRSGTDDFYDLETFGMPGFADEYKAPLYLPFVDQMNVTAWLDNNSGSTVTDVDVNLEYALVERTIVEKALYGLRGEVDNEDRLDDVQEQIRAGVPIDVPFGRSA